MKPYRVKISIVIALKKLMLHSKRERCTLPNPGTVQIVIMTLRSLQKLVLIHLQNRRKEASGQKSRQKNASLSRNARPQGELETIYTARELEPRSKIKGPISESACRRYTSRYRKQRKISVCIYIHAREPQAARTRRTQNRRRA